MKKRSFGMVLLLSILILVILFYAVATTIAKREKEKENDQEGGENTAITYINKTADDVESIIYRSEGYDLGIKNVNGKYILTSDETFPLDQVIASDMAGAVAVITFDQKLNPEGNDLTEYGLNDPQTALTVAYSDGARVTLAIGNYNRYTDSHYCQVGDDFVYLLSGDILDYFTYSMTDLLQDETVTLPSEGFSSLTKVEITEKDGDTLVYNFMEAGEETEEDIWQKILNGEAVEGDFTSTVQNLYNELFKISLNEWAAYNVTGNEALDTFGLATPEIKVVFHYIEKTTISAGDGSSSSVTKEHERAFGFDIGSRLPVEGEESPDTSDSADYDRYFMLEGGKIVYIISEGNLTESLKR